MSFGENLKAARKQRHMTQEELAETLGVSRQAISKWESDNGYPETEKLLTLSKALEVSVDALLSGAPAPEEKKPEAAGVASAGKIAIRTYNGQNVVFCQSVKSSAVFHPGKNEPRYVLNGIDKVTFWGEHSVLLGWYATLEDIEKEIAAITDAIRRDDSSYTLAYHADVEDRALGFPRLRRD